MCVNENSKYLTVDLYLVKTECFGFFSKQNESKNILSKEELQRFQRYTQLIDAHNFYIGRHVLRTELSRRLNCEPNKVNLAINPSGKPYLIQEKFDKKLYFSITHCCRYVLVAISEENIGVDAELIDRIDEPQKKAKKLINNFIEETLYKYKSSEYKYIFTLSWTALESYVKFSGSSIAKERKKFKPKRELEKGWFYKDCMFNFIEIDMAILVSIAVNKKYQGKIRKNLFEWEKKSWKQNSKLKLAKFSSEA